MSRFIIGACLGMGSIAFVPEESWSTVRNLYHACNRTSKEIYELICFYSPSEQNKRKSEEIKKSKEYKESKYFKFTDTNDRKTFELFNDLQDRIRIAELSSNQRGVSKQERISIIQRTLKDHYPELQAKPKVEGKGKLD